jgi:hypothetical protein
MVEEGEEDKKKKKNVDLVTVSMCLKFIVMRDIGYRLRSKPPSVRK